MWFRHNRVLLGKISLLLVVFVLTGVGIFGCAQAGVQPKGWSGVTIADGTMFLGSMEGELVAVSTSDGSRLWPNVTLENSGPAGGGFGCAAPAAAVAIYGNPAVSEDLVYIGGYNGRIYAVSSNTGLSKWEYLDESNPQPIVGGPVVALGKVYIGSSDGKLYALNSASLEEEWGPFETGGEIWSTPVIDDETVFIGSFDKKLYALDAVSGEERWEFETGGAIAATALVHNNTVYIGSFDRRFYAVDIVYGTQVWKFPFTDEDESKPENWFWAKPVAYNNVIYIPCLDGKVYILGAETGLELAGAVDLGSPIFSSPILVGNSIILATEEGRVYAIDIGSNQKSELANLGEKIYAPLSASEGIVYIHTEEDTVYGVEAQTGAIREFNIK